MVVVSTAYILLSFAKVDKIIVEYNISHWGQVTSEDTMYLMYEVSLDAAPAIAQLHLEEGKNNASYTDSEIEIYYSNIRAKENSGRKWNYSISLAKKAADEYFDKISK